MRLTLILIVLYSSISLSQENEYNDHRYSCIMEEYVKGNDTIDLQLSTSYYANRLGMHECFQMHDRWHWWFGSDNRDSILTLVRKKITPFIGEKAANRTVISQWHNYNNENTKLSKYDSLETFFDGCYDIAFSYDCYVELGDSLWLPFHVSIDKNGKVIDTQSMPKALKKMESFNFISLTKAYKIVDQDPYMKGYGTRRFISLKYSREMEMFYYEIESEDGDLLVDKSTKSSTYTETMYRHMYINPIDGDILWKTKVKHTLDFIGCVYDYSREIPDSPLTR